MKNVLITGGAGGIGQEIVRKFISEGFFVYIVDIDEEAGQKLIDENQGKCKLVNLDVTKAKDIKDYCKSLDEDFVIDHIITLAGRALPGEWIKFEEQEMEEIESSVNLNLLGHINIIHAFLPYLKKSKGNKSILMISSINATDCFGLPAYSASKSGLYGFMNAVLREFGEKGIRINVLSPGTVVTEATKKEPKDFSTLFKGTALNKFTTSEDVALFAYDICNNFLSLTGQNLILDAGQSKMHNF